MKNIRLMGAALFSLMACLLPNTGWAMFPIKAGDTLSATMTVSVTGTTGDGTVDVRPMLTQPDGVTILGATATFAPNGLSIQQSVPDIANPELGTYLLGFFITNNTNTAAPIVVTLRARSSPPDTTLTTIGGFNYLYLGSPALAVSLPAGARVSTELTVPVSYFIDGFP